MKRLAKAGMMLAAAALVLTGCNCHNKMAKQADGIRTAVTPQVLVVKGNNITTDMTVTFPQKYVNKKSILRLTPVLVFEGGEIAGTPKFVQGEKVADNYTVIPYKAGGSYTQTVNFPYDPRAEIAMMRLVVDVMCGCDKEYFNLATFDVAQGVSNISGKADWASFMSVMPDNFKRVTTNTYDADVMYQINSSAVRNTQLSSEQIKMFEQFLKDAQANEDMTVAGVYAKGYASPDGPEKFNDKLSKSRSESAKTAVDKQLKKTGVNVGIDAAAYGEDWDGFRELVEQSNIKDKDLILQVLNMYSSPAQRDQQIRNMSQVFSVLKKDILPQLRRSQMVANVDVQGKTDAELREAVANNINSLNVEEMLFAATLVSNEEAVKVYKAAADKYNDVRAWNNYGIALIGEGRYSDAEAAFKKALSLKNAPEISNNIGVMALIEGNPAEAKRYIASLSGAEARANQGLIALAEGDFATATRTLNGYNLAVAELANGNVSAAKAALGSLNNAKAEYLRAIIAMREGNTANAISALGNAFQKEPSLREQALRDIEFYSIRGRF
ncbi:tetratricopeptide repeat protein [Alistipes sp. OttesenSCG-928-B03]|nr:tetratricopeptide repeat protein [Alistipes sp. OttesenSCG-928-B03]